MKKYIYTYQTKNLINGKTYIGYHSTNNLNDGYIGCGVKSYAYAKSSKKSGFKSAFICSVVKYGYENFSREILSFFDTIEEAKEEERFLVSKDWVNNKNNYNISLGGNGGISSNFELNKDKILNDFKNGMFLTHISKKYKVSYNTLKNELKDVFRDKIQEKELPYKSKYANIINDIIEKRKTIPNYSFLKICKEYKMDYKTAKKICGNIPVLKKEKEKKELKNKYFGLELYFNGEKIKIDKSIREFCKERNIKENNFRMMLTGNALSANGFSYEPKKYLSLLKNNEIIFVKEDLKCFCLKNEIPLSSMHALKNGKIKQTKGYTIYNA